MTEVAVTDRVVEPPTRRFRPRLFAANGTAPSSRRATDVSLVITSLLLLIWTAARADPPASLDVTAGAAFQSLPAGLKPLWEVAYDLLVLWAVALVVAALVSRRVRVVGELAVAAGAALVTTAVVGHLVGGGWQGVIDAFGRVDEPPVFPAARLSLLAAVVATASPFLARPLRWVGRALLAMAALSVLSLSVALPGGAVAALAVGWLVAGAVHLVFGSPGWRPDAALVLGALSDLGIAAGDLESGFVAVDGVAVSSARDRSGRPLDVKVYGRDAYEGQFLATLWRFLIYRDSGPRFRAGRLELVEHEAFVTLLAARRGVAVPEVVTAGETAYGDAVLVVEGGFRPLTAAAATAALVDQLWQQLGALHRAGIAHGRLDHRRVVVSDDGRVHLTDFGAASVTAPPGRFLADRAAVLAISALLIGNGAAVARAIDAVGAPAVAEAVPYLQPAALSGTLRRGIRDAEIDLDDLRARAAESSVTTEPELVKLRRVSWGSLLQAALLVLAAWFVLSAVADVGIDTIVDELRGANWWWVAATLFIAQLPRIAQGVSTLGATTHRLPLGPNISLEFAVSFINLAVPSTAARVTVKTRFFQRLGLSIPEALSVAALDSLAGFVVQAMLLIGIPLLGLGTLGLRSHIDLGDNIAVVVIVAVVVVVLVGITLAVRRLRALVVPPLRELVRSLAVLRSPSKLALLFGGNLVAQLFFAIVIGTSLAAFGASASLTDLLLVNSAVSLVAGLLPVPGGIGVTEAGLIAGLVAIGIPEEVAASAAIVSRISTFYLPPLWGVFAYRSLQRNDYL